MHRQILISAAILGLFVVPASAAPTHNSDGGWTCNASGSSSEADGTCVTSTPTEMAIIWRSGGDEQRARRRGDLQSAPRGGATEAETSACETRGCAGVAGERLAEIRAVRTEARAEGTRSEIWDTLTPAFGVRVTDKGTKSYAVYTRWPGTNKPTRRTVGDADKMTLASARAVARDWLDAVARGVDPAVEAQRALLEKERRAGITFRAVAESYIAEDLANKRRGKTDAREIRSELIPRWADSRERNSAGRCRGSGKDGGEALPRAGALSAEPYEAHL